MNMRNRGPFEWTERLERRLRAAMAEGVSQAEFARRIGTNPKTIQRKVAELGLPQRASPTQRALGTHALGRCELLDIE